MLCHSALVLLGFLALTQAWKTVTFGQGVSLLKAWNEASSSRVPLSVNNHIVEEVGEGSVGDYVATRWTGTKTKCSKLCKLGLVRVNSRKVFATHRLEVGDVLSIREGSKAKTLFNGLEERLKNFQAPAWLLVNPGEKNISIKGVPAFGSQELLFDIDAVLEFYSR